MPSVNKVIVLGNLGADPELRYTRTGQAVCNFRVATNERYSDSSGETHQRTEWHRIVAWGNLAQVCHSMLSVGDLVYIEGRLQTRKWNTSNGELRISTEIVARNMQSLQPKESKEEVSKDLKDAIEEDTYENA